MHTDHQENQCPGPLTWIEINLKAIQHNLKEIQRLMARNRFFIPSRNKAKKNTTSSLRILAVIKSDGYGHGLKEVGLLLEREGIEYLGVSDIREGMALRRAGIKVNILLFESTLSSDAQYIGDYQLTPAVCTLELASALNDYGQKKKKNIPIHIKVDTGMGRLGIWHEEAFDFIKRISQFRNLTVEGIYTHFPAAETDRRFTQRQIKQLHHLVLKLDKTGLIIPYIHAANSMGLIGYKTSILNLFRPGIMIYGLHPHTTILKETLNLQPALSVKSKIIFLKTITKGRSVSYGRTFIANKNMRVATIPIGYNDGYPRILSNKACVLIDGVRCPVIGRVTMEQTVVDVSKLKKVEIGMPVVILGTQKSETISADELAQQAGTINYEIICSLGNRLPRIYV